MIDVLDLFDDRIVVGIDRDFTISSCTTADGMRHDGGKRDIGHYYQCHPRAIWAFGRIKLWVQLPSIDLHRHRSLFRILGRLDSPYITMSHDVMPVTLTTPVIA